ncbi:MAG: hypothetical protein [Cressdnaviricota sp.]|nr:MAG: hypothetical protein [Cressdnaviricota sp.]
MAATKYVLATRKPSRRTTNVVPVAVLSAAPRNTKKTRKQRKKKASSTFKYTAQNLGPGVPVTHTVRPNAGYVAILSNNGPSKVRVFKDSNTVGMAYHIAGQQFLGWNRYGDKTQELDQILKIQSGKMAQDIGGRKRQQMA